MIYLIYLFNNDLIIFKSAVLIVLLTTINLFILHFIFPNPNSSISEIKGQIVDIDYYEDYLKFTIKSSKGKVIVYGNDDLYEVGDIINVSGVGKEISKQRVFGGFDYFNYLKYKRIIGVINANEIKKINSRFHIGIIKQKIYKYLKDNFSNESMVFLRGILLGDSSMFAEDFKNSLISGGIIHLFAISGLHIQLFISLLEKLLKKVNFGKRLNNLIVSSFLLLYLISTSWSPSVLRASLMYLLSQISKYYKLQLSTLDVVSIVFILLILINPYYIYNYGFLLSFLVSFIIIIFSSPLKDFNPTQQVLILSTIIQIITLPIVVNLHNSLNLFSPLINVIYIYVVSTFVLPMAILLFLFPFFDFFLRPIIVIFIKITIFIGQTFSFNIKFPIFSEWNLLFLFLSLFFLIRYFYIKKLRILLSLILVALILIVSNKLSFNPFGEIYFLDLFNGESIIIKAPFDQCNVVIDTGDGKNKEVEKFLKNHGFKRIDYLVLTHNHLDHNGEALGIIQNFKVKNIVVSYYDEGFITNNFNTMKVKENDVFGCKGFSFKVLNPNSKSLDENDNSIVLYTSINNRNFLFLGDATKEVEERLLNEYNLEVDVLKVGHHGSQTSTSPKLVQELKPKYAIIMNGNVSKFGFPHEETLQTLRKNNVKVYATRDYYSIKYQYFFKTKGIFHGLK